MERYSVVAAPAVLVRGKACWSRRTPTCPLCGEAPAHGGGPPAGDPRRLLGHRVPHCADPPDGWGYELVEPVSGGGR